MAIVILQQVILGHRDMRQIVRDRNRDVTHGNAVGEGERVLVLLVELAQVLFAEAHLCLGKAVTDRDCLHREAVRHGGEFIVQFHRGDPRGRIHERGTFHQRELMRDQAFVHCGREALFGEHHAVTVDVEPIRPLETGHFAQYATDLIVNCAHAVFLSGLPGCDLLPRAAVHDAHGGFVVTVTPKSTNRPDRLFELVIRNSFAIDHSGGLRVLWALKTRINRHECYCDNDGKESPQDAVTDESVKVVNKHS